MRVAAVQRLARSDTQAAHWLPPPAVPPPPAASPHTGSANCLPCPALPSCLQNQPLYLATFAGDEDTARLSTMVHCSLDAVEEKGAPAPGGGPAGLLPVAAGCYCQGG